MRMVWASLFWIKSISGFSTIIRVLHVGGTIRLCTKYAIKYDRNLLAQQIEHSDSEGDEENVQMEIEQNSQAQQDEPSGSKPIAKTEGK